MRKYERSLTRILEQEKVRDLDRFFALGKSSNLRNLKNNTTKILNLVALWKCPYEDPEAFRD